MEHGLSTLKNMGLAVKKNESDLYVMTGRNMRYKYF